VASPIEPEVFGEFLLFQRIDSVAVAGGDEPARAPMSEVLRAVRLGDRAGRLYVVKRPRLGERASGRAAHSIAREGEVLAEVRAPEIVALEAAGEIAGLPYVAVEHVRGAPLDVLLAHAGALPPAAVRAVALDLARALAAVHAAGWVHGDIAPSNVLVDDAGECRLIDFGLATRAGAKRADIAGKPGYVAPEAIRVGAASPAEDVYGWGVVVAECALGARLFEERDLAEAASRGDAPRRAADLAAVGLDVTAALRRDAAARPEAQALIAGLGEGAVDRGGLADLVAAAARAAAVDGSPSEPVVATGALRVASRSALAATITTSTSTVLTPTAPMVALAAPTLHDAAYAAARRTAARDASSPLTISARVVEPGGASSRARPPGLGSGSTRAWKVALLLAAVAVLAAFAGRLSARPRQSSVSFAGTFPRRVEVRLDGQLTKPPVDGSPLPLSPGRHTLALTLPKGEIREYTFQARAGQHVVLVPLQRSGASIELVEDRDP
jgi:serine/threonine-protein kinase